MSTPLQIITLRAPDFATEPNIDDLTAQAGLEVSDTCFGDLKNKAIALIVMHWIALSKRDPEGTTTGSIKSEKEGDLARSYGSSGSTTGDPYYSQTAWGLEYLRLLSQSIIGPRNRFINAC